MHNAERSITGINVVAYDSEGKDIHDVGERLSLLAHFGINTVKVFFSADDCALNPLARQRLL